MKIIKIFSKKLLSDIEVIVECKKIKNIRLRVFPSGMVKLSVPLGVSKQWIDEYLTSKVPWLEKSLDIFKNRSAHEVATGIQSGVSTCILGRPMIIMVKESKIYKAEQREELLYLYSPVSNDEQALQKQFERWLQKQSKAYFGEVMERFYPVIAKFGFDRPKLQVRKMKTLWGSCSRRHHKINLNCILFKAPPACVEYVVLHELAHFIYPHHNKEFYAFLTTQMSDWKERKRILNQDYARWLSY